MPRILPARPNLEHLKHQAKDLLTAYYAGDHAIQQLFAQYLSVPALPPRAEHAPRRVVLAHALVVLAREYGFASWTKLKQHIELGEAQAAHRDIAGEQLALKQVSNRDDFKDLRKIAQQQRIAQIAEHLVTVARQQNLWQVFAALCISGRDGHAVRAYLVEHDTYSIMIDALLVAATHANARIRFLAVQAMDHFADQRCEAPLRRLLYDPVPRVRWAAIHSLQCATCKLTPLTPEDDVVAILIDLALHDSSIKVRRVATYELGQVCADVRAIAALEVIRTQATDRKILRDVQRALERYHWTESQQEDELR